MLTVSLQTSKLNSVAVPQKNLICINDKPIFLYNLMHSLSVPSISKTYAISDIPLVHELSKRYGYISLKLSDNSAKSNHYSSILEGLEAIENYCNEQVDILVILLGNTIGALPDDLENSINILKNNPFLDSVCSISQFNAFNPSRAFHINDMNILQTVLPQNVISNIQKGEFSNNKEAFGDTFFFNGSFWVCRRSNIVNPQGDLPFPWLGRKIRAYKQDIFMEIDDYWQIETLKSLAKKYQL